MIGAWDGEFDRILLFRLTSRTSADSGLILSPDSANGLSDDKEVCQMGNIRIAIRKIRNACKNVWRSNPGAAIRRISTPQTTAKPEANHLRWSEWQTAKLGRLPSHSDGFVPLDMVGLISHAVVSRRPAIVHRGWINSIGRPPLHSDPRSHF